MATNRFMIAPLNSGLQRDLEPWMIPDDAFETLENAYVFRGSVKKRFGSLPSGTGWANAAQMHMFSRLRVPLTGGAGVGITDGAGAATGTVPGATFKIGQMFSIGDVMYTVSVLGTPGVMLETGTTTTHTFNTTTGVYAFTGAANATQVYFYTAEPVMGITKYGAAKITDQPTYAFDTQFAYKFAGGTWARIGAGLWHGDSSNFFWSAVWEGVTQDLSSLFVSNFNVVPTGAVGASDDPIATFDGATWADFVPKFLVAGGATGNRVNGARIIVPFKDRLLLLDTIESDAAGTSNAWFPNRCRYSQNGSPFATEAFYEKNQVGYLGGGFIDCPTREVITGAEFIKDRLIVYFERSTWELAYTGNQVLPFVWQKINTELGSAAPYSVVPFDKVILTFGDTGVHACNGANVERIDDKIPDEVFKVKNEDDSFERVAGIRDYFTEMVYWTFMTDTDGSDKTFPDKILAYNYKNGSWSFNDDCFTTFGYFEQQDDMTWGSTALTWGETDLTWGSGVAQADARRIVAGNQQGFVLTIDAYIDRNAPGMYITNMTNVATGISIVSLDHTLDVGEYVYIEDVQGATVLGDGIYQVNEITDANTFIIDTSFTAVYTGGGVISRVSEIDIKSKQWNPYISHGKGAYLSRIEFCVQKTTEGELTVDYYPSSSALAMIEQAKATGTQLGSNILETSPYDLEPFENTQDRIWHSVFFNGEGDNVQIRMFLSDDQLRDPAIAHSPFKMEALILYFMSTYD